MRILLALSVMVILPGVVLAYLGFQATIPPVKAPPPVIEKAAGRFDVELTLTFDVAVDEFDLERRSLVVALGKQLLLESSQPVKAGQPLLIKDVKGMAAGRNTIVVKAGVAEEPSATAAVGDDDGFGGFSLEEPAAAKPVESVALYRAMRVRVLRDAVPIASETIWSEPGAAVQGVFDLTVPAAPGDHTSKKAGDVQAP